MVDVAATSFAALLKQYRVAAGLTQEELAERANLSARAISDLERGVKHRPYPRTAHVLIASLGLQGEQATRFQQAARLEEESLSKSGERAATDGRASVFPTQTTAFIGRRREVAEIGRLLTRDDVRLLTLTGPGGVGKTRLALKVAEEMEGRFPDGTVFVGLASLADPGLVTGTIANALGVKDLSGQPILERLIDHLKDKRLLLVLDNLEHLLPAAESVSRLLASCRELAILVTSRAVLHLAAEHEYPVVPLAVPTPRHLPAVDILSQYDAVQLFLQRARAVKLDFALSSGNASAVVEICWRLDGLPLAVELAAARVRLFSPQGLLERLSDRLGFLTGGPRDAPARQQTLRNTLDWSYRLLNAEEQDHFARLSVFVGGCTFEAAEAVCNPDGDMDLLECMSPLVDNNLLLQVGDREPRFSMLETIREYAAERLQERGAVGATRVRHAAYYRALAEEAEPKLSGPEQLAWLNRLDAEHDNLRAALRSMLNGGQGELALELAGALALFWRIRGYGREGMEWLEEALRAAPEASSTARARGLAARAQLLWDRTEVDQAEAHAREALSLYRTLGDRARIAYCLNVLGNIAFVQGEFRESQARYGESLAISSEIGLDVDAASTIGNLGLVAHMVGDCEQAAALLQESVQRLQRLVSEAYTAYFLGCLSRDLRELGDLDGAEMAAREGLALGRKVGWPHAICAGLLGLAELASARGEYERAADLYDESLHVLQSWGSAPYASIALVGRAEAAIELGDDERAREALREALALMRDRHVNAFLPRTIEIVAWLLSHRGQLESAARLFGGAAGLRRRQGTRAVPSEQRRTDERMIAPRKQVGEEYWGAYWREGEARSGAELLEDALEGIDRITSSSLPFP